MATHIFEQDQDGMIEEVKQIFLVRQTQPENDYQREAIYAMTDKDEAIEIARKLNKLYANGVILNDDGDFIEIDYDHCCIEEIHYYDVESMTINEQFK